MRRREAAARPGSIILVTFALLASIAVAATPVPRPQPSPTVVRVPRPEKQLTMAALDARIVRSITELFQGYERRAVFSFARLLSPRFRSQDSSAFGHTGGQMVTSVSQDYHNLRDIDFTLEVYPPQYMGNQTARVDLHWQRRARFDASGQEWIVRDQRSTLIFNIQKTEPVLEATMGDPMFGLTNPVGVLVVFTGTIDGIPVSAPVTVLNGKVGPGTQDADAFGDRRRRTLAGPLTPGGFSGFPPPLAAFNNNNAVAFGPFDFQAQNATTTTNAPLNQVSRSGALGKPQFFTVTTVVKNLGTGTSPPSDVTFDDGPEFFVVPFASIPPGGSIIVTSPTFNAFRIPGPGLQTVFATANSLGGTPGETNNGNNTGTVNLIVFN